MTVAPPPAPQSKQQHRISEHQTPTPIEPAPERADYVSLRRAGDIINLLPILQQRSKEWGRPVRLVVHREFAPLLEGASYVTPVIWDGDWEDAMAAATQYHAVNAQVFARGVRPDVRTHNFARLAWTKCGARRWERHLPLVFDRRNHDREASLAHAVFKTDKPKLLIKMQGNSSPFPLATWLDGRIRTEFGERAEVVSLDSLRAERLYDLVGLMDRANCLVTVDTVTLWLSHASPCPSVQLVNGTGFAASPPRGNCIKRLPYLAVQTKWHEIANAIKKTVTITPHGDSMVCTFMDYTPDEQDARERHRKAAESWPKLGARLYPFTPMRSSKRFADPRGMPYIRDMVQAAFGTGTEDIIVITNNDIIFGDKLREAIIASCQRYGCYWAYRTNLPTRTTDQGADVFAFTRSWWHLHEHLYPDFLLGYWWFDDVLVRLMRWSGCLEGPREYFHVVHRGVLDRLHSPGQKYNERLANQWLTEHQEDREKP